MRYSVSIGNSILKNFLKNKFLKTRRGVRIMPKKKKAKKAKKKVAKKKVKKSKKRK